MQFGCSEARRNDQIDACQNGHAGKTVNGVSLISENTTGAIAWEISFTDIALVSANGTVRPIYTRQKTVSMTASGSSGVTGRIYQVNHLSNRGQFPDVTTNYYHGDHLSTSRMMTSVNGYPVWQATYLPFGGEYNAMIGVNNYKFTGKERDGESGLDYFGARYYAPNFGRFVTPDWSERPNTVPYADFSDPQTLNLYGYVRNNPLSGLDQDGHDFRQVLDDLRLAMRQVTARVSIGIGYGRKVNFLGNKVRVEVAWKANVQFKDGKVAVSETVEAGASARLAKGKEVGLAGSVTQEKASYDIDTGQKGGAKPPETEWVRALKLEGQVSRGIIKRI